MDPTRLIVIITAGIVALAGIFSLWGAELVKKRLPEQNETGEEICQGALFEFYSGNYDESKRELYIVLDNRRPVELKLEKLYLFYPNGMRTFNVNENLEGNILKSIILYGVDDGFISGTIKTNCPGVSVDFSYSQLG